MRLSFGQTQSLRQVQKLSPKMIQSMEILQLPLAALLERLEQEVKENPVLEIQEGDPNLPDVDSQDAEPQRDVEEKPIGVDEAHDFSDDFERLDNFDRETPDYFEERPRVSGNRMSEMGDRAHDMMANAIERPVSLGDHLIAQLSELSLEPEIEDLADRIISTISSGDGGYFRASLRDLLPPDASDAMLAQAERALDLVQSLDPPGVAARNLRECLAKQLESTMPFYEEARTLVLNHLEDLAENRLPLIQRSTGYSIDTINHAADTIRHLNPRPAAGFTEVHSPTVKPDVYVDQEEGGGYRVRIEDDYLPRVRISHYYLRRIESGEATQEERDYVRKKQASAQWLMEAIEQRRSTLTKVAQAIVDHQHRFLDEGPNLIEPLKMQQVADQVGVHVTTVSRAVDDKWMQTPRGMFPLRKFFVSGTQNEEGEDVAWDTVRVKLQELIDNEDKKKPLSDDALVKLLKQAGLTVARRTVTKYREQMRIPSSRQRRDWSKV